MGGEGSGRKPDVLRKVFNQVQEEKQAVANLSGDSLYLPNYSGINKGAIKTGSVITNNAIAYYDSNGVLTSSSNLTYSSNSITLTGNIVVKTGTVVSDSALGYHNVRIGTNVSPRIWLEYNTGTYPLLGIDNNGSYLRIFKPNQELWKVDGDGNVTNVGNLEVQGNVLFLINLPTSDPAELGAIWVDTASGFVLKQSQG